MNGHPNPTEKLLLKFYAYYLVYNDARSSDFYLYDFHYK